MITRESAKRQVGEGWSGIIDEFYDKFPDVRMTQVKEKYGGLCLYHSEGSEESLDLELDIRERSTKICEECGEPGELREIRGWVSTKCDSDYQSRLSIIP